MMQAKVIKLGTDPFALCSRRVEQRLENAIPPPHGDIKYLNPMQISTLQNALKSELEAIRLDLLMGKDPLPVP
jgi:hypothetical protein